MTNLDYLALEGLTDSELTPDEARLRATVLLVQCLGSDRAAAYSHATMDDYFATVSEPDAASYADEQSAIMELVTGAWPHLLVKAREVERGLNAD